MNIVVTGAASFVGINLINQLLLDYPDANIFGLVRPNSTSNNKLFTLKNKINLIEIDMENIEDLQKYLSKIDAFYLVAWRGTRSLDRDNKAMQKKNYCDSIKAIKVAIHLGCKTIVGVGSQAEYGITYKEANEEYKAKPVTQYGIYKLKVFEQGIKICKKYNVSFKWGRIFSAYGVGDYEKSLVMYCVKQMLNNEDVHVSSCKQSWNFINIKDVAKLFSLMLKNEIPSGAFNIASDDTRVLKNYVLEIANILKSKSCIIFESEDKTEPMNLLPSNQKIKLYLNNFSFMPFSQGITEIKTSMEKSL